MKRLIAPLLLVFLFLGLVWLGEPASPVSSAKLDLEATPTPTARHPLEEEIIQAVLGAVASRGMNAPAAFLFGTQVDQIRIAKNGEWAATWLTHSDPVTGEVLPGEPGLAILHRQAGAWQVSLPDSPDWQAWLQDLPQDVMPEETKGYWQDIQAATTCVLPSTPFRGYLLPWEGDHTVSLSGSVLHDSYIPSGNAHFAFDFSIPSTGYAPTGQMFEIFAAKPGVVWWWKDSQLNNDTTGSGNYLVLRDTTTTPTSYQLYMHLAHESIPLELKVRGAPVFQGQIIAIADNTGGSTGSHLHFMVYTENCILSEYWGRSADITFNDVAINGGRPRRTDSRPDWDDRTYCLSTDVCQTFQNNYVSGNRIVDPNPPTGALTAPLDGGTITGSELMISGWASDVGTGLQSIQIVAAYSGSWFNIGPTQPGSPFSYTWDLCAASVPPGPVVFGLRLLDNRYNQTFLPNWKLSFTYACPSKPPACQPTSNQVALFTAPDYGGNCALFGVGAYPNGTSLGVVGDDQATSILVGANVQASLFVDANFLGRAETVAYNDSNLSENLVGSGTVSSLMVQLRTDLPFAPQPVWPPNGKVITDTQSISLYWRNGAGALQYQAQLSRGGETATSAWQTEPYWQLGTGVPGLTLTPGIYNWKVRGMNNGGTGNWSSLASFNIQASSPITPSIQSVPYLDDMEVDNDGWTATGLWHRQKGPSPAPAHSGDYYWWFGTSNDGNEHYFTAKEGDLTSSPIEIPGVDSWPVGGYSLRFWYRYQTETKTIYWDQRWLQLRVDDGPFTNIMQLSDDPRLEWLQSPAIDLTPYAGHTVQLRFRFDTVDPSGSSQDNDFEGWYIDDVEITTVTSPPCSDPYEPDDTSAQAYQIPGQTTSLEAQICPPGDRDYYKFYAFAGNTISADLHAQSIGSSLDPYLILLDQDGSSVLAENDDVSYPSNIDSHLSYRLPRTGYYYLKVRPYDYPSAGGPEFEYRLDLFLDNHPPQVQFLVPVNGQYALDKVQARVNDVESGISKVEFFMHGPDWLDPTWQPLNQAVQDQDVWTATLKVTLPDQAKIHFYALAYDQAGNVAGAAAWNVTIDRTPPVTALQPLNPIQNSTAVLLTWTATDSMSGPGSYDLQYSVAGGAWQAGGSGIPEPIRQAYLVLAPGSSYGFRMRGSDRLGNLEAYPTSAETTTSIPTASVLCSSPDSYENDNTAQAARTLAIGASQDHNLCNPLNLSQPDIDWVKFNALAGKRYVILSQSISGGSATILELYAADQVTLLAEVSPSTVGQTDFIPWIPTSSGTYYLKVRHFNPQVLGNGVVYRIKVFEGYILYFPFIYR